MSHSENDPLFKVVNLEVETHIPFIIDMHKVRKIDTAGLGSLIMVLIERRKVREGRTFLIGVPECVDKLLDIYKIPTSNVEIYRDIDEALMKLYQ